MQYLDTLKIEQFFNTISVFKFVQFSHYPFMAWKRIFKLFILVEKLFRYL